MRGENETNKKLSVMKYILMREWTPFVFFVFVTLKILRSIYNCRKIMYLSQTKERFEIVFLLFFNTVNPGTLKKIFVRQNNKWKPRQTLIIIILVVFFLLRYSKENDMQKRRIYIYVTSSMNKVFFSFK